MSRKVQCIKLGHEAEGLQMPPYPGKLGQRIFEEVSKEAWQMWLGHQTMLINENRLTPIDPKDRAFLEGEMDKFFFGEGSERPKEYVDPDAGRGRSAPQLYELIQAIAPNVGAFGWCHWKSEFTPKRS